MKLKIYHYAKLLILLNVCVLNCMEQPTEKQNVLSLKFLAGQQSYHDFARYTQVLWPATISRAYFNQHFNIPTDLKEYLWQFEPLNQEIVTLVNELYSTQEQNTTHEKEKVCSLLQKKLFRSIDKNTTKYILRWCFLKNINTDSYSLEEKSCIVQALLNKSTIEKEERLKLTQLLEKALKFRHHGIVYILANRGTYLNKRDKTDNHRYQPAFRALSVGSLRSFAILLEARLKKAKKKNPEAGKKSMTTFLTACARHKRSYTWASTLLSVALAIGSSELLGLLLSAAERGGVDLPDFLTFKDKRQRSALHGSLWRGDEICEEFPIAGLAYCQEPLIPVINTNLSLDFSSAPIGSSSSYDMHDMISEISDLRCQMKEVASLQRSLEVKTETMQAQILELKNRTERCQSVMQEFFAIASKNNVDIAQLLTTPDWNGSSLLAYTTDEYFEFLLKLALDYHIDLETVINAGDGFERALSVLVRERGNKAIKIVLKYAESHNLKLEGIEDALEEAARSNNQKAEKLISEYMRIRS